MTDEDITDNLTQNRLPEEGRARYDAIRDMPGWKRIQEANRLTMAYRTEIMEDVRRRYPHADENEIRRRFAARVLPREDVIRIFGWDPELEDD